MYIQLCFIEFSINATFKMIFEPIVPEFKEKGKIFPRSQSDSHQCLSV